MKILFLSDNFPPEVNAPASRTFEHCKAWVEAGHQVTVITCAPNFPKGRVYEGYKNRLWSREELDGIQVIRVWSYITANEGFLKRILDYVSFMFSASIAGLFVKRPDVIVGTSPQFFTACAACFLGLVRRRPYVFELRDLWPESIRAVSAMKESRLLDWLEKLELFLYRKAAMVISVTESFKRNLIGRGIDGEKIHVITNGVDLSRFQPMEKDAALSKQLGLANRYVAGYVGTHGLAHALETIIEAGRLLQERGRGDEFRLILLGEGARKQALRQIAEDAGVSNVLFLDSVPKAEVPRYWSVLDASIIHLKATPLFETVIPSKLFESMGMGLPVLHGVQGESAQIVRDTGAGIVFESENAEALADALIRLREDSVLQAKLRACCLQGAQQYERNQLAGRMAALLQQVAA